MQRKRHQLLGLGSTTVCRTASPSHNPHNPHKHALYVNNINFQINQLGIFHISPPSPNVAYNPVDSYIVISPLTFQSSFYFKLLVPITTILQDSQSPPYAQFTPLKTLSNSFNQLTGMNIQLSKNTVVQVTSNSIFDILQNVWGFAIVCFTVILYKFTKYINLRAKDINMEKVRADFRENICIFLSKIYLLKEGNSRYEIQKARYYLKQQMKIST